MTTRWRPEQFAIVPAAEDAIPHGLELLLVGGSRGAPVAAVEVGQFVAEVEGSLSLDDLADELCLRPPWEVHDKQPLDLPQPTDDAVVPHLEDRQSVAPIGDLLEG